jgi:hypothetical protein|tara:strand:- start:16 stop:315 length:300 start_codon:yes stop_codon:yes gene_type:complete
MNYSHDEIEKIILNVGDIIVDHLTGYVGVLSIRDRHIDITKGDVYFWEVRWSTALFKRDKKKPLQVSGYIKEETLKLSILIGKTELYSIEEENEHSLGN